MKRYQYTLWLTIVVILAGMTACGPREIELPFETIERSDYGDYSIREPRLILITAPQEIDQVEGLITQEALDRLAELDFGQYFAIAVFRGCQPDSGYDTIIKRVARRGDKVVVYAQFWEPSPHYPVTHEATSSYHLVKVHKDGDVSQEIELVLQSSVVTPTPPF